MGIVLHVDNTKLLMNLLRYPALFCLFINFVFCSMKVPLVEGTEFAYKFKYREASKEYREHGGDQCVHKAPQVQICGQESFGITNATDEEKQLAYENCLRTLNLHELLVAEAAKITPGYFGKSEAFKVAYTIALNSYAKALDEKYKENGTPIESKLIFTFNWLPWVLILAAAVVILVLNRNTETVKEDVESSSPVQPVTEESIYETV